VNIADSQGSRTSIAVRSLAPEHEHVTHIYLLKQKERNGAEGRFELHEYHDKAAQADSCGMEMLFTA
jgi:hypothetical protein